MKKGVSLALTAAALAVIVVGGIYSYNLLNPQGGASITSEPSSGGSKNIGRTKAADFTVQNADGNITKLSDMLGKPIVLNFWASWCPPCKSEMPEFDKVYKELGGSVQFIMIDLTDGSRETVETAETYIRTEGLTLPVFYDTSQDAAIKYNIRTIPTTFFINNEGYIINTVGRAIDEDTLRTNINLITAAAAPT